MQVHLAIVENKGGIEVLYCGSSSTLALASVVDYCRSWWYDEELDLEAGRHEDLSDIEVVQIYFENVPSERIQITEETFQE
jgi:hypothetical protein